MCFALRRAHQRYLFMNTKHHKRDAFLISIQLLVFKKWNIYVNTNRICKNNIIHLKSKHLSTKHLKSKYLKDKHLKSTTRCESANNINITAKIWHILFHFFIFIHCLTRKSIKIYLIYFNCISIKISLVTIFVTKRNFLTFNERIFHQ